jgi:hypothetical protein
MYSEWEELNAYVYHSLRAAAFDVVIWCLGPYVDDSRDYGFLRIQLAHLTCGVVRRVLSVVKR